MPELENTLNANSANFFPLIGAAYTSTCGDAGPSSAVTGGSGCLAPNTMRLLRSRIRFSFIRFPRGQFSHMRLLASRLFPACDFQQYAERQVQSAGRQL
jgi:hypothetical protein